jgi:sulfur relay (sulfurtransferase) DsrF/TusC family protein
MKIIKKEIIPSTNFSTKHMFIEFEGGTIAYVFKHSFESYGKTSHEHVLEIEKIQQTEL